MNSTDFKTYEEMFCTGADEEFYREYSFTIFVDDFSDDFMDNAAKLGFKDFIAVHKINHNLIFWQAPYVLGLSFSVLKDKMIATIDMRSVDKYEFFPIEQRESDDSDAPAEVSQNLKRIRDIFFVNDFWKKFFLTNIDYVSDQDYMLSYYSPFEEDREEV